MRGARPDCKRGGFSEGARCGRRAGCAKVTVADAWSTAPHAAARGWRQLDHLRGPLRDGGGCMLYFCLFCRGVVPRSV